MSSYKPKLVYKFLRLSTSLEKNDLTTAPIKGLEKSKAGEAPRIQKLSEKRMRGGKSRKCKISALTGCGSQREQSSVIIGRTAANSPMQEVCSAQSLPSCSSLERKVVEKCPSWISSASFDEMIKRSSNFGCQDSIESHYSHKSSSQVHISPVKFNELVNSFRKSKEISTSSILSADNEKPLDANFQPVMNPEKFNSLHRPLQRTINEPRLAGKVVQSNAEKCMIHSRRQGTLTESLLIIKSSCDPQREFKDSMMEMIYENEIKDGKDMEELLACYLFLNSAEYHDLIIQVFKQVWTDLMQT